MRCADIQLIVVTVEKLWAAPNFQDSLYGHWYRMLVLSGIKCGQVREHSKAWRVQYSLYAVTAKDVIHVDRQ